MNSFRGMVFLMSALMLINCSDENPVSEDAYRLELLQGINELRVKGCFCGPEFMPATTALTWDETLASAAQAHADDMFARKYFNHISPEGTAPINRAIRAGYDGPYVGEIIARGYDRARDVVQAWQESESHCKAMMDTLYNEMAGGKRNDYWVVNLGRDQ